MTRAVTYVFRLLLPNLFGNCMARIFLKPALFILICTTGSFLSCQSQSSNKEKSQLKPARADLSGMASAAHKFLESLTAKQKNNVQFDFDDNERYNWHYVPKNRKGIALKELEMAQYTAAMDLLRTALSDTGFKKTTDIIQLEGVLRGVEGRPQNDEYRDPGKYYFSIFGNPSTDSVWGWRLEGHHISFNFSALNNTMVSGTPGFLGTNPAVVLSGPEKGKYILKNETEIGFALLHSLDAGQNKKAVVDNDAPAEIITAADRKAIIEHPEGILYSELSSSQQTLLIQLLSIYIHRYTHLFA